MHNKEKFPAIWAEFEKAREELAPLEAARAKKTDAIAALQFEISELQMKKVALNEQAMADAPRIAELRDTVARLARAMGARTASGA